MLGKLVNTFNNYIYMYTQKTLNDYFLFECFYGKSFSGDTKYLAIDLKKDDPSRKIFVTYLDPKLKSEIESFGLIAIKFESITYYKIFYRSKFIVSNSNLYRRMKLKDDQRFIQTWHGHPIKNMVKRLSDKKNSKSEFEEFNNDLQKWDYLLISSNTYYKLLDKCFIIGDSTKLMPTQMPRHNYLLANYKDEDFKRKIREKFNLPNKKIILITPTWRKNETVINLKLNRIAEKTGCHIVVKPHPHDSSFSNLISNVNFTVVDSFIDVYDLVIISSYLISDYSSLMLDFLLINENIICHVTDFYKYKEKIGFLVDIKEKLGIEQKNYSSDELIELINTDGIKKYDLTYIKDCVLGPYDYTVINQIINLK